MSQSPPHPQSGFTLVEMLVALAVFALLSAAGVGILRSSVDTQAAVDARLTELGQLGRLNALLSSDLAQAVDRPTRSPAGRRPAFSGDSGGMQFVRSGWANLDGATRSELQRVSWRMDQQALARIGFRHLDGGDDAALPALLARSIRNASFRYRLADGSWVSSFESSEEQALPAAVELTLAPSAGEPIVMIVALPAGAPYERAAA